MKKHEALAQIDSALTQGQFVREDQALGMERGTEITSFMFSVIERLTPPSSSYAKQLEEIRVSNRSSYPGYVVPELVGLLRALRRDVESGYLKSVSELIHADTFGDLLSMAQHLLEEGYKDPAAVVAGTVLEQHLRLLAQLNEIETSLPDGRWKKAESVNADLARKEVYSKLDQKSVTSWLGLRNEAAHGNYGNYAAEQVRLMIDGVNFFISRYPA